MPDGSFLLGYMLQLNGHVCRNDSEPLQEKPMDTKTGLPSFVTGKKKKQLNRKIPRTFCRNIDFKDGCRRHFGEAI